MPPVSCEKVLKSAVANAKQNPNIDENILYVKEVLWIRGPPKEVASQGAGKGG